MRRFLFETTARNEGITLDDVSVTVEGDFDARGIKDVDMNPRIQRCRAVIRSTGPTYAETQRLAEAFKKNCPISTTLAAGAPSERAVE